MFWLIVLARNFFRPYLDIEQLRSEQELLQNMMLLIIRKVFDFETKISCIHTHLSNALAHSRRPRAKPSWISAVLSTSWSAVLMSMDPASTLGTSSLQKENTSLWFNLTNSKQRLLMLWLGQLLKVSRFIRPTAGHSTDSIIIRSQKPVLSGEISIIQPTDHLCSRYDKSRVPTHLGRPKIRTFPGPFQDLGQINKDLQLTYDS